MEIYQQALEVMKELFAKDYTMALATSRNNIPSVRFIDTYYQDEAFYIVTDANSRKVQEILENPNIALTNRLYQFSGKAFMIGHPLKEENKDIRGTLIKVFEPWYFAHNDEFSETMCYVKIELEQGFFYKDNTTGYKVDFINKVAEKFPFTFDIIPIS